jgi:hypothetical protein
VQYSQKKKKKKEEEEMTKTVKNRTETEWMNPNNFQSFQYSMLRASKKILWVVKNVEKAH